MRRVLTATAAAALAAALPLSPAFAQGGDEEAARGFYLGGALTQARFDDDAFSVADLDDEDNSWKAIAGVRFNDKFGLEANYIDFGEAIAPAPSLVGAEAKGFALYAVGTIPVPYFDFFVKLGAAQIDAEGRSAATALFDDDATEFAYGAGLQWRWRNLAVRAEYEKFDTDVIGDLDLISVGLTYTFDYSF